MSVDYRLMFVYHGSMMVMMLLAQVLQSVREELLITAVLVTILVSISVRHRKDTNWHWPGVGIKDVLYAVGYAVLIAFFLGSAMPLFPPSGPSLPWYLAGAGLGTFGILSALKFVYLSEADFLIHCRTMDQYGQEIPRASALPEPKLLEATWKKIVRGVYTVVFVILWVAGVLSFYVFGTAFKAGSEVPTATQTEPLTNHGHTVYITPGEKQRVDRLQMVSWIGFPLLVVSGLFLHFVVGVKLFGDTSTMTEYVKRKLKS